MRLAAERVRAEKGDRVLDIGCGPADWLELLPGVEYVGIDFNPDYIEAARQRYGSRGTFEVASVSDDLAGKYRGFDIALAMGVLHHLTDSEVAQLMEIARAALRPGGRLVTLDGVFIDGQPFLERWIVSRDRGRFVRTAAEYERLAKPYFPEIDSHIHRRELRIPYSHLSMVCTRAGE